MFQAMRQQIWQPRRRHQSQMSPQPVSLLSSLSYIYRNIQDQPIKHERTAAVYEKVNLLRDHTELECRKDAVLLAQVWSCHGSKFKSYQHLTDLIVDILLVLGVEIPHTVEHWLTECPGRESARLEVFCNMSLPLGSASQRKNRRTRC